MKVIAALYAALVVAILFVIGWSVWSDGDPTDGDDK